MNTPLIVSKVNYGSIDSNDTSCQGYYIIIVCSYPYTLQEYLNIDVQVISYVEMLSEGTFPPDKYQFLSLCFFRNKIKQHNCIFEGNNQW